MRGVGGRAIGWLNVSEAALVTNLEGANGRLITLESKGEVGVDILDETLCPK